MTSNVNGLKTELSAFDPSSTLRVLEEKIVEAGMQIFAKIDHAAGAKEAGLELRPTTLLIFGTAKAGTALMQAQQTVGIDLPLKALIWEDADGHTWVSYDDPHWLVARHGDLGDVKLTLDNMAGKIDQLVNRAISRL
ncbi:MAG TPA: DUF302 domain-containing protein [Polyangiaceae bacterium]